MNDVEWWREWLGVPDRAEWYVGHEFSWRADESAPESYEYGTLTVRVGDASAIGCGVLSPPGARWQRPIVLVPFYRVAYVTGRGDPGRFGSPDAAWRRAFATHLAEREMTAVAVPWWFESMIDENGEGLTGRYGPAAAEHHRRHTCTGLGRSLADLVAVLDALDRFSHPATYGCFGHSLGGKLALFLSALDDRIAAAVASEPGLGWAHSNWSDPWYVGDRIPGRDHDELLAAIPPRRMLLIAGGESDGDHNQDLVANARRRAGRLADRVEVLRHAEGHAPPWWALEEAYAWLRRHSRP